jgi:GT2 family glycosyltransferase
MQSLALGAVLPGSRLLDGIDGRARPGPEQRVGWISGVCMVMRRADFIAAGGFDPAIFRYCEDIDLCARLALRGTIMRLDTLPVRHYGGASSPALAAKLRNTVWAQRNLLRIVRARSGPRAAIAARLLLVVGALLRLAAGLALAPRRGFRCNVLLRSSWLRLLDLVGALPGGKEAWALPKPAKGQGSL